MGCLAIMAIPSAGLSFFFSPWIVMVFWGVVAGNVGVETISYRSAMLVTLALWMAAAPLIAATGHRRWRWWQRLANESAHRVTQSCFSINGPTAITPGGLSPAPWAAWD